MLSEVVDAVFSIGPQLATGTSAFTRPLDGACRPAGKPPLEIDELAFEQPLVRPQAQLV